MKLIGIDPGISGAVAWTTHRGDVCVENMPETVKDLADLIAGILSIGNVTAFVEKIPEAVRVGGRTIVSPKLHRNMGQIEGILQAMNVPLVETRPQEWQKAFGVGKSADKTAHKNKLKAEAQRRFPNVKVTLANADALLILEAARMGAIK